MSRHLTRIADRVTVLVPVRVHSRHLRLRLQPRHGIRDNLGSAGVGRTRQSFVLAAVHFRRVVLVLNRLLLVVFVALAILLVIFLALVPLLIVGGVAELPQYFLRMVNKCRR